MWTWTLNDTKRAQTPSFWRGDGSGKDLDPNLDPGRAHSPFPRKHNGVDRNVRETDKDRTKNKMVFLNWMNITMQLSKGIGVQVWPHLARDALLWQHFWLYLKQLHCYGLASAPVRGHFKLNIIWEERRREKQRQKKTPQWASRVQQRGNRYIMSAVNWLLPIRVFSKIKVTLLKKKKLILKRMNEQCFLSVVTPKIDVLSLSNHNALF